MKWLASFALLAIQLQLLFSRGVQGFQTTCGQEYNYTAVPSTIKDDPSYNARDPKINWKGYMNAIDCLGRREGSFCPFITRMVFHDSGAVDEATPTGSDGSLFTSSLEGISPANTQYGEAPTLRYMLQKLIEKFGISWADGLGVAALVCTNTLGSDVNVQQVCSSKDTPFYVGKLDGSPAFANIAFDLPFPATSFDAFVSFWTTTLSGFAKEDKWKFSLEDAAALMGSHILNVPHGCTRGAYFRQRNRNFDNGYFKDLLSGTVTVALDNKTICDNKQPCVGTPDQGESAGCKFSDSNIERRNEVARVQVADAQKANGFGTFTPSPFPAVNWKPDYRSRGPCYGQQCICCAPWDVKPGSRRPFCIGRMVGECMWPYTINDGFMAQGVKSAAPAVGKDDLLAAYTKFRDDLRGFREAYAVGLCKLAHVAPRFGSAEAVDLYELVGDHVGKCWELGYDPRLVWGVFGPPQCRVPEDKVIRKRRPFEFFFHH